MKRETISNIQLFKFFKKYKSLGLFILGLLFDLVTLGRIDRTFYLFQHALFLLIIFTLFAKYPAEHMRSQIFSIKKIAFAPIDIMQFFYGSLLSHYFYFYFRSSSFLTWIFLILITLLLLLNELAYERKWYVSFKIFLFPFCTLAYFVYLVPILLGTIGIGEFYLSIMLFFVFMVLLPYLFIQQKLLARKLWLTSIIVLCLTLFFYEQKLLPPVPLHVTKSGVFTTATSFKESLVMSAKKIEHWRKVKIAFSADSKIFYIAKIFSPSNFKDQLYLEWKTKKNDGWFLQDKIIFAIEGKEDGDYRGVAWKENWGPGEYQITLITEDGRILDNILLEVVHEEAEHRWDIVTGAF